MSPADGVRLEGGRGLSLEDGMVKSAMTFEELWLRQIAVGGLAAELEIEAYVLGLLRADDYQYDLIAQALNEYFVERGQDHPVGYSAFEAEPAEQNPASADGTNESR